MLEVRNLYKTYRSKTGVNVLATNGVSLKFKKTGLCFIVGKSGCGKSTLLNLLGGLDRPDGGEIIINGTSSLKFSQSDFDSYRNTYVGFVFQEYNLLKDFSVGANVALALELKGEKASDDRINDILKSVDLDGYGYRRINELSGGQKQRVAIARALVKNPEIILADEPSGALDSASAKMLFDTLKSLSKDKLVIVVSHDRDFAFSYGDRVIEMKDGEVISDEEKVSDDVTPDDGKSALTFGENEITIPEKYVLGEADLAMINDYLQNATGKTSLKKRQNTATGKFRAFDSSAVEEETETFKPIKSSLPLKCAFKMGASNLGIKKFRLILTILLSVISFTMFGLYDVMASYNKREATINSIVENGINFASYRKINKIYYGDGEDDFYTVNDNLSKDDIAKIEKDTGVKMTGVFSGASDFSRCIKDTAAFEEANESFAYYPGHFGGYVELNGDEKIYKLDFSVGGEKSRKPVAFDEIAIPQYVADTFLEFGLAENDAVSDYPQLVGKKITLVQGENTSETYTICGVFSTGSNYKKYKSLGKKISDLKDSYVNGETISKQIAVLLEINEFNDLLSYSFNNKVVVCDGFYENKAGSGVLNGMTCYLHLAYDEYTNTSFDYFRFESMRKFSSLGKISVTFFDERKTTLGENEVIIPKKLLVGEDGETVAKIDEKLNYTLEFGERYSGEKTVKIVGYCDGDEIVVPDSFWREIVSLPYYVCFGSFDGGRGKIETLVDYSLNGEKEDEYYELVNHVTTEIEFITTMFAVLKSIFIWVGGINAIFAALLLSNFIALGVVNKKTEIGILRAIGARGSDVFKVFFSESGIIAGINFLLSTLLTGIFSGVLNGVFARETGIIVTIMNFGLRQIALLLVISFVIAAIASFLPVYKLAKKKPVDVILNK